MRTAAVFDAAGLAAGQLFVQRFQLIRRLGEGGMGQVWLAEQIAPVRRSVALKLIKAGMYDETVVQRFQAERQSLAIMDHPAIAKVFDAGIDARRASRTSSWSTCPACRSPSIATSRSSTFANTLELFIQACEGVQHAHQKAIIHRDLKPANILVIEVDGKPVPRIIDFGLAKAATAAPRWSRRFSLAVRPVHRHARLHEPGASGPRHSRTSTRAPTSTRSA